MADFDFDDLAEELVRRKNAQVDETVELLKEMAECSRGGVIYGVHLAFGYFDDSGMCQRILRAVESDDELGYMKRHSPLIINYFFGERRDELRSALRDVSPRSTFRFFQPGEVFPSFSPFHACAPVASIVNVYDPDVVGLGGDAERIESRLKNIGVPGEDVDEGVGVFVG